MKVSFANPHVAEKCRILAGMEAGKWYGHGRIGTSGKNGAVLDQLIDGGFLARRKPTTHKRRREYILTPAGEYLAALLRQIGVSNGAH